MLEPQSLCKTIIFRVVVSLSLDNGETFTSSTVDITVQNAVNNLTCTLLGFLSDKTHSRVANHLYQLTE